MDKEVFGDVFTPSPLKEQENIEQVRKIARTNYEG